MTDDLVKRLRSNRPIPTLPHEAADRIEALTAENERLRLKLKQASNNLKAGAKLHECPGLADAARVAFEALEKQP